MTRKNSVSALKSSLTIVTQILDAARWAPSGDNTQPWRFEIIDGHHIAIHGHDTRDWCVYDLKGHGSQLALGALLESITIAASQFGLRADCQLRSESPVTKPIIDIHLHKDETVIPDPLYPYLPVRSVNRCRYRTRPLTSREKQALETSVAGGYRILWFEGWKKRLQVAKLMFDYAKIRLTMPEAYEVHARIIEWNAKTSTDKIPDKALGLDELTLKLMRWAMKSWERIRFLNTWLAGTLLPRIELDLLPGIFCAAHFAIVADKQPQTIEDHLKAGRALQRFWLTVTSLGLQLQPEMTPLIFSGYIRNGIHFTKARKVQAEASRLSLRFCELYGDPETIVFTGRVGEATAPPARSIRKPLSSLMVDS